MLRVYWSHPVSLMVLMVAMTEKVKEKRSLLCRERRRMLPIRNESKQVSRKTVSCLEGSARDLSTARHSQAGRPA